MNPSKNCRIPFIWTPKEKGVFVGCLEWNLQDDSGLSKGGAYLVLK